MSRRTKLLITALFLVLLGIPTVYVALTWHAAEPFRFRYLGRGEVVMHPEDPFGDGPNVPMVPIFIEVQNTRSHPVYLGTGELALERGRGYMPRIGLGWVEAPIPGHGTLRHEILVTPEAAQRVESEALEVTYEWATRTKVKAYECIWWLRTQVEVRLHYSIRPPMLKVDSAVSDLVNDRLPEPSPSRTTPAP
jgi:hypothetical protein